jgi:hypothetical protein
MSSLVKLIQIMKELPGRPTCERSSIHSHKQGRTLTFTGLKPKQYTIDIW